MNTLAKNLSYAVCLCLLLVGAVMLAGCGGSREVTGIKVTELPDKTTYVVGEDLQLEGGVFTVTREDGSTDKFDLKYAEPSITHFDKAGVVTIVMTYAGKTSTFNVTVNPADFIPTYTHDVYATYTGEPLAVSLIDENALPAGMSITGTAYKVYGADDSTYTATAPTNVGKYQVRVTFDGGDNYNDTTIVADYTIEKADYLSFATNGYFNFQGIDHVTYGENFDLSKTWSLDDQGGLGAVPLPAEYASNIKYYFKGLNDEQPTEITPNEKGEVFAQLNAGTYDIIVKGISTDNLNEFTQTRKMVVESKQLELGVDFDIIVTTNGDTQTKLQQGIDNIVLVSVPSTDTSASISIVFYGDAATYCNQATTVINMKFGNKATAEYTYVDTITSEGYYRIELQLDCPTNNYRLDVSTYIGFQFDITE